MYKQVLLGLILMLSLHGSSQQIIDSLKIHEGAYVLMNGRMLMDILPISEDSSKGIQKFYKQESDTSLLYSEFRSKIDSSLTTGYYRHICIKESNEFESSYWTWVEDLVWSRFDKTGQLVWRQFMNKDIIVKEKETFVHY